MKSRIKKEVLYNPVSIVIVIIVIVTLLSPYLAPYDPLQIDLDSISQPPSTKHIFGTDNKGRDILSRVLYGARISIVIGIAVTAISVIIGLIFGVISGYSGGRLGTMMVALIDLSLSFPALLLAIGISVVMPPGAATVVIALVAVGWASFARLVRGMVISLKEAQYIEAARASGASTVRILIHHTLPQCIPLVIVTGSLRIGGFILAESALSFLGIGIQPPTPTWGSMVSLNRIYIYSAPWMVIFPGLAITITVVAFNLFGDKLRDLIDPKSDTTKKSIN
ncbi:MAG: ABC transporter permease [Nitrospirota bacterium]